MHAQLSMDFWNDEKFTKYKIMPPLPDVVFAMLKADIAQHGILVPIEKDEHGIILDGHHRIRAWGELRAEGVKVPQYEVSIRVGMTEPEKLNHIRSLHLCRKNYPEWQLAELIKQTSASD